jgi:hypothetical protein
MCDCQSQQKRSLGGHIHLKYSDYEHNCDQCNNMTETKCQLINHNKHIIKEPDSPVISAINQQNANYEATLKHLMKESDTPLICAIIKHKKNNS